MKQYTREITKEQYENALSNHRYITEYDKYDVFSDSERLGYGVYSPLVHEENGKYYVLFELGDTCD